MVSGVTSGTRAVPYGYETGRNLVTSIENKVGATTESQFTYFNNALGQRETRTQGGTAFPATATETFGYNGKGELETSTHSGNSARNTSYGYDGIGNRNTATFGGATTTYAANPLNQCTAVSSAPQAPTYDLDGNQETDFGSPGALHLVYDGENRLKEVRNASAALLATYTYDGQSRRVKKSTTAAAPKGEVEEIYLYDGWNRIATYALQPSSFTLQTSLTWGHDLSGTTQGAGGVGGLLAVRNVPAATKEYFTYDANGNVSELLNTSDSLVAHYEYDPFGNAVVATGTSAASNPWRFSTKPVDPESGYSYYGYRFYNPVTGRWPSRDPIGEEGGINLYGYVSNNPVNLYDPYGLWVFGGGANITAGIIFGIDINIQIVVDSKLGVGLSYNGGFKAGLWAGLGISPMGSVSTACKLEDTTGPSVTGDIDFVVGSATASVGNGNNEVDWKEPFGGHSFGNPPPAHPVTISVAGPGYSFAAGASGIIGGTGVKRFW